MASTTSQPSVLNSPALNNSNDANGGGVASGSMQEHVQATTFVNAHGYGGGGPPPPPSLSYGVPPSVNHPPGTSQESPSNPAVLNSLGSSAIPRPLVPGPSFSYKISHAGVGFPGEQQASGMNNTGDVAQENKDVSFAPSTSQSNVSLPLPIPSSSAMTGPLNSNIGSVPLSMHTVTPFQVAPGVLGTPATLGAPAMVPFAPIPSNSTATSASMDFSSPLARPNVPNNALANVALQQHAYPSVPPMVTSPQGPWFLPPQNNGLQRPPFLPYPVAFPSPFSQPARAMPLSSVPLSSSVPPGVTSATVPGETPMLSATSGNRLAVGFGFQQELPPGTDNRKQDVVTKDGAAVGEQDSWTAHRTETGVVYYYNALTGESTYEKPPGFKEETDKVTAQPTPVSCEKLAGTDWVLVTTNDGKKYYHNTKTKLSSWQIPNEVADLKKKQDVVKDQAMSVTNTNTLYDKGSGPVSLSAPAVNTGGRDAISLRASGVPGSSSALDLIKKKLQDSGDPATSSSILALSGTVALDVSGSVTIETTVSGPHSENSKDANGDANLSDSSSDSEDVNSSPTKEERVMQFKAMLKERGVAPFSKWEKELPKIVFDPRFKAIPSYSARKALFEHYVRTRAEEERKEKRAAQKAAIEGFKQLLEEAKEDIDHNTDYPTFKKKWGHDPRFEALDRKEREVLLNERVVPLKKAAEERAQAVRAAAASSFKSMLLERGDIDANSRWSKVKESLRNDSRYKSVKHEDRETLFSEYILELKAAEEEIERVAKAKWDEEEKLKERERELRKRKEREEQEVVRVRSKARRKEAVESYQALLVETIKDSQASWTESKTKLEKDPQGRAANPYLDQSDLEKLFREHVKLLNERCAQEFRALLSEVVTAEAATDEKDEGKTVLNSWSTAKRLLKADPRYTKMPRKERESLWRRHVEDVQRRQKRQELGSDREAEKRRDGRGRNSVESGKYLSGSRY